MRTSLKLRVLGLASIPRTIGDNVRGCCSLRRGTPTLVSTTCRLAIADEEGGLIRCVCKEGRLSQTSP